MGMKKALPKIKVFVLSQLRRWQELYVRTHTANDWFIWRHHHRAVRLAMILIIFNFVSLAGVLFWFDKCVGIRLVFDGETRCFLITRLWRLRVISTWHDQKLFSQSLNVEEEAAYFCGHTIIEHWWLISRVCEQAALHDKQSIVMEFVPLSNETESWHPEPETECFVVFVLWSNQTPTGKPKEKEKTTENWIHIFNVKDCARTHTHIRSQQNHCK